MFLEKARKQLTGIPPEAERKVVQQAITLFFLFGILVGTLLGGGAAVLYHLDLQAHLKGLMNNEAHSLDLQEAAIQNELDHVTGDILFLAGQNELILHLDSGDEKQILDMQREYKNLSVNRHVYGQIRYLNGQGIEQVRVDNLGGVMTVVPQNQLQNKLDRYYFKESFALERRSIFLSPLDLNIENGKVERPFRPVLRLGTPVFDSKGRKRGIVLINYDAEGMLQQLRQANDGTEGRGMLLNSDGYWLLSPDTNQEWGFMFPDRAAVSFAREFPAEWHRMLNAERGHFRTRNGLFSFKKTHPLAKVQHFSKGVNASAGLHGDEARYFWVLLTRVPPDDLLGYTRTLLFKLFMGGGGLFLMVLIGAWYLAMAIARRRAYQDQLVAMALYDALTGLPNRKLFFDHLTTGMLAAKRYERKLGLLYIDLDGFKDVNDTKGHESGDELLVLVGDALRSSVRQSDTVARLGGDEFAIILSEVQGVEEAGRVGEKIVMTLGRPFGLKEGTVTIGASVGVAVYPDHGDHENTLIANADRAMYLSKSRGKNTCTVAPDPGPSD